MVSGRVALLLSFLVLALLIALGVFLHRRRRESREMQSDRRQRERREIEGNRRMLSDRRSSDRQIHDEAHNLERREGERRLGERRGSRDWIDEYKELRRHVEKRDVEDQDTVNERENS